MLQEDALNFQQETLNRQKESLKQSKGLQQGKEFQNFQNQASEKAQLVLKDPSFQEWITTLQNKDSSSLRKEISLSHQKQGNLYVFVSFSLGEKALLNLAFEAKRYGATLVLRGFKEGSYAKTVAALYNIITKSGQGVLIDPELFNLFAITAVPTVVLAKPFSLIKEEQTFTPLHDRLQGHVSVQYALESFAKKGDLKAEAQRLLEQASSEKEQRK
ncbi:MAG: type-F conjugative transfer system pilin assembly protein TrbC [Caedimonadaceae bacterium]|nr:MAG: type-F conjugative transfer system pilin assembly protein TrbC [Caedimonadaceae bacterium]